jgi:hypothetical protein
MLAPAAPVELAPVELAPAAPAGDPEPALPEPAEPDPPAAAPLGQLGSGSSFPVHPLELQATKVAMSPATTNRFMRPLRLDEWAHRATKNTHARALKNVFEGLPRTMWD